MRDGERVVGGDLQEQVAVVPRRVEAVDRERRQRREPCGSRTRPSCAVDESRPETECDSEAGGDRAELGLASAGRPWVRRAASSVRTRIMRCSAVRSVSGRRSSATRDTWACGGTSAIPAWCAPKKGIVDPPLSAASVSGTSWRRPDRPSARSTPMAVAAPTPATAPPRRSRRRLTPPERSSSPLRWVVSRPASWGESVIRCRPCPCRRHSYRRRPCPCRRRPRSSHSRRSSPWPAR